MGRSPPLFAGILGGVALLMALAGCGLNDESSATKDDTRTAPATTLLACGITSEKDTYRVGEAPEIHVRITNLTGEEIYLVGSLDGSSCRWRYPHCYFEITTPYGDPPDSMRCGLTNRLRDLDFVKVPPGGSFDPYQHTDEYGFFRNSLLSQSTFHAPGEYRLKFTYSTAAADLGAFGGDAEVRPNLAALFVKVPKVTVTSNEIAIKLIEAKGD